MSRALLLLFIAATVFGQVPYTFRKVIDNAPGSQLPAASLFFPGASINDQGAVAFTGGNNVSAYYVSPQGVLTLIGGSVASVQALNNSGTVVYFDLNGGALKVWSNGTSETIHTISTSVVFGPVSINDQGTVVFAAQNRIIQKPASGPAQDLVSNMDIPRKNVFTAPTLWGASINNAGEVAFVTSANATCEDCIYKKAGGQLIQIAGERGGGRDASGFAAINELGEVAYIVNRSSSITTGYYAGNGGSPRLLADLTNSSLQPADDIPSFNDRGQIAFMAMGRVAGVPTRGIYTGPDPVQDRVIADGDALFGQTVATLEAVGFRTGRRLNNKGQILFQYMLTNGVSGLAIATPTTDPVITKVDAEFMGKTGGSTAMYLQVKGANLASTARIWAGSDFNGATAPTVLDGTRATVGGKTAVVQYISPRQVNIIVPEDTVTGPVDVQITTPTAVSNKVSVNRGRVSPALLTTPAFLISGLQHVVAQTPDFASFIGNPNMIEGAAFRRARVGETVIIYAVGLGQTSPPTTSNVITGANSDITSPIQARIGGQVAQVTFAGAVANAIGLYQLNVVIPNVAAGNRPLEVTVDGVANAQNLVIAVGP